ncbi:class I SAM-dependent methyltransferase [Candidatus Nitronereus thalassa]|uniref:Methyltransferase domain-containing protein n=1 Tax=Candidatus Nitronereus thalassa TaxID=3020898 RepID=A0ABU3K5L7_9BACT|nr:methyltransferase domain-containing protein [Candidatus Nitronereus thalassa]MDT7041661.1 methyltransferase domain-containing protein [Candidatus Nitronereus thalassa]
MTGARILEAGSGAGRFTEILCRTGATVFSFDYSNAIEANALNNGANPNLHLFQGDILTIPLPEASFDHVLCLGVLQHTRDPRRCFLSLARHIKPGGDVVIDVYRRSFATLLQWKYFLRPLTRNMKSFRLYRFLKTIIPVLIGPTRCLRSVAGRVGARLSPIVEYTHLGLAPEQNLEWALLDTFDMYAPAYDKPQTLGEVRRWFQEAGLIDVEVFNGINGIVGRGRRPIE